MEVAKTINSERKRVLRKDHRYLHVMKYMGSKRELLPDIRAAVEAELPEGGGVLDLFAGTGSVGMYLRDQYDVLSNDVQSYSSVICDALIVSSGRKLALSTDEALDNLKIHFEKNCANLSALVKNTVKASNKFLEIPKRGWTEEQRLEYIAFFESFPSPVNDFKCDSKELRNLKELFKNAGANPLQAPYCQTTFLFAETYFSTLQAIQIDSIRYAIDAGFTDEIEKSIALTALIYAYSYCSSGTGHFAMFRDLKSVSSVNDVFLYRDRDVWTYFENKFREIIEFHEYYPGRKHQTYSLDCFELLKKKSEAKKYDLIYADPPYSFVHYSRFYHAIESLIKYDYQMPEHKGRYRTDRHQSPFCQQLNVKKAFSDLFELAAAGKKIVLLSYSDTGMISIDDICALAANQGFKHKIKTLDYDHSTMGRAGHKSNSIKEYLITFRLSKNS